MKRLVPILVLLAGAAVYSQPPQQGQQMQAVTDELQRQRALVAQITAQLGVCSAKVNSLPQYIRDNLPPPPDRVVAAMVTLPKAIEVPE